MSRRLVFAALILLGGVSSSFGQATTSGTGAINGRVSDASQALIPGVTVTITSPSLMGARTAVTDGEGQYRFTAVPPGDYVVAFELSGFRTVRNEGIRVSTGFTATINAEMKLASLEESVTVTRADLRRAGQRQDGRQVQLRQVLVQPWRRFRLQCERELVGLVASISME